MLTRYFNTIKIDHKAGTLTKSSEYRDKLRYEVKFYESSFNVFSGNMPELLGYAEDYSSYTVRYINGIELGELYASDKCSVKELTNVFGVANKILTNFEASLPPVIPEFLQKIFIDKTLSRSEKLEPGALRDIFFLGARLNGKDYRPLNDLIAETGNLIRGLPSMQIVLHGDMCFSNVIVESDTDKLFFVDPRGGFESPSIYGPAIYDVAKLAQSVVGLYDSITNNQYLLSDGPDGYTLRIYNPMFYKIAEKKLMDAVQGFNLETKDLRVLAGVMLAGAPIFHIDDENRAIAIALRCVELLGN